MKEQRKNKKEKLPDELGDAIWAVSNYDDVRLNRREIKGQTAESLHKTAVKLILVCNNVNGSGTISISKARTISAGVWREAKIKNIMDNLKCERPQAMAHMAEKKAA